MLKGKKIILRPLEPEDIDYVFKLENDISVWQISNTIMPFSKFEIEQYVLNSDKDIYISKQLRLIIEDLQISKRIGCIDLFDFDPKNQRAGIGIIIDANHRNSGYATDALEVLIQFAFKSLNLHQLHCSINPENTGSVRLFVKSGFRYIGTRKDWVFFEQRYYDEECYQLLRDF